VRVFAVLIALATLLGCATERKQRPTPTTVEDAVTEKFRGWREQAGRPSDETCAALTREGDALLAAGKREQAIASYDRTRNRCIDFSPLRRQLFLARHPGARPSPGLPAPGVYLGVLFDGKLGPDLQIADWAGYLDGVPIQLYMNQPLAVGGVQELHIEFWIMARDARGPGAQATLVDIREQVVVHPSIVQQRPLLGAALVRITDRQDGTPIPRRLSFEIELRPLKPVAELQKDPVAMMARADALPPVMVPPNTATGLRITDPNATIPAVLKGRRFWSLHKVCVLADGQVERVTTIKPSGLGSEQPIHDWVKQWKYRPYLVDGIPRRFCAPLRLEIR
jgi:hypothetical protein